MIITKQEPFTKEDVEKLREAFDSYIKTVIDIEKKVCSAGCDRHFDSEKILLEHGSAQSNLWGGGIDVNTKVIDFGSFINVRPQDDNPSNELLDQKKRKQFEDLTKYFFKKLYE